MWIRLDLILSLSESPHPDKTGCPALTATLWLVIVDHPETYTSFQIKPAKRFLLKGMKYKILRIGEGKTAFCGS